MGLSSADLRRAGLSHLLGEKPANRRKKPGTGDHSEYKRWFLKQLKGPGVFLTLKLTNPLNNRQDWRPVWRASKEARETVQASVAVWLVCERIPRRLPVTVTMTRYGPRKLDEGCGLNASLKPVRDGVADVFEVDDADPRYTWVYQQEQSKHHGVRVCIQPTISKSGECKCK